METKKNRMDWDRQAALAKEQRRRNRRCSQPEPCAYYIGGSCEYMAIMGHCRPCKPGDACTVKTVRLGRERRRTLRPWSEGPFPPPAPERAAWSPQAEALYKQGCSDREIAEAVGRSRSTIGQWRRRNDLPPNVQQGFVQRKPLELQQMEALYDQGYSDPKIAAAADCAIRSVFAWRKRTGRPPNARTGRRDRQSQDPGSRGETPQHLGAGGNPRK